MSEKKGPLDAAINHLTNRLNSRGEGSEREELRQAIRVLEDWPKWEPLIEAAGKVDKKKDKKYIPRNVSKYLIIRCFDCAWSSGNYTGICDYSASCASAKECAAFKKQVRTLLASLPEKE